MNKAIFVFFCAFTSSLVLASPLPDQPHIYVEGSAKVEVEPDTVTFSVSLEKTDAKLETAKADVDQRSTKLIQLLQASGIPTEDLAATTLRIYPAFSYADDKQVPIGTTVSRSVEITVRELTKYSEVMTALIEAEISETISTRVSVSKESEITDKALEFAMNDARQRATRIAETQSKKLGEVYSISEFMTREDERYFLQVSRTVTGQASDEILMDTQYRRLPAKEIFVPGKMIANAQIYVVFLLE